MKIGLFADPHYSLIESSGGVRFHQRSFEKMKKALAQFQKEGCELVVCLGDLVDKDETHEKEIENLKEVSRLFDKFNLNIISVMGNHDAFQFTVDEFYSILGEKHRPKTLHCGDKTLIFVDACYFENGVHYLPGDDDWTNTFLPHLDELEKEISNAQGEVYIFMHQNADPEILENHRIANDKEFRSLIEKSNRTKMVIQGHYHAGKSTTLNGIHYLALPAMCEHENTHMIIDI